MKPVPVIAIDGPSASGKGAVAHRVAERLGFWYLDSGAIYRAAAVAAARAGLELAGPQASVTALAACARSMNLRFEGDGVLLDDEDVTVPVRSEAGGRDASQIATLAEVRGALLLRQREFRRPPGLVADGRDMASVVFPEAALKIYLTADVVERARRRVRQLGARKNPAESPNGLIEKENNATLRAPFDTDGAKVLADLVERDRRDAGRSAAPLKQVADARLLDTTFLSIDQAVAIVLDWFRDRSTGQGK